MATFDDLWQQAELTRRKLIAAGAASGFVAGFALSAQPVMAQTMIVTDTTGLQAGMVQVPTATGPIPAYRAAPSGAGARPLVLVVQEIFGVHEHIKDVCRRLAKLGYCAVAPSLYERQGDVTKLQTIDEIRPIVAQVPDAQVMSDLDATVDWAAKSGAADPARLAITGFCWGGRIVWLYAAHNPNLKAGIAWYGRLVGDKTARPASGRPGAEDQGTHPDSTAPDGSIPVATEQMKQARAPGAPRPSGFAPTRPTPSSPTTALLPRGRREGRLATLHGSG
jgi:dienelactone hydrolase